MTVEGDLIPLADEKATEAQQRATAAEQRAEQNLRGVKRKAPVFQAGDISELPNKFGLGLFSSKFNNSLCDFMQSLSCTVTREIGISSGLSTPQELSITMQLPFSSGIGECGVSI